MVDVYKRVVTTRKGQAHRIHMREVLLELFERVIADLGWHTGGQACRPQMEDTAWLLGTTGEMGLHMAVALQRHLSVSIKFGHVESRYCLHQ